MKVGRRRGLSPIVAELLLVAITVSIGSTLFFVASSSIGGYTNGFSLLFDQNANAAKEIYMVEYAQFTSGAQPTVNITIRNVGYVETELASVSLFNLTSVGNATTSGVFTLTTNPPLAVNSTNNAISYCTESGSVIVIPVGTFCQVSVQFDWVSGAAYNVVISTERGNSVIVQEIA